MTGGMRQGRPDAGRRPPPRRAPESLARWSGWLTAVAVAVAAFGVFMSLFGGTPLFGPIDFFYDPSFWPGSAPAVVTDYQAWVYGVWGATLAGWGIVLVFIARGPFAAGEAWAWRAVALGTAVWFVLDTLASLMHGVLPNVILNVVVLVLVAIPLWGSRREFR
jgi:hypothetical protein